VDQVIFVLQAGPNRHEHICESLELFAQRVMPAFAAEREARERAKADHLAPAIERALARREPARQAPPTYVIDEAADLARAARAPAGPRERLRAAGQKAMSRLVRGATDAQLERRFGSDLAQRAIFTGMAKQFEPKFAHGFEGDIAYELSHPGNGKAPSRWTVRVSGDKATVVPGIGPNPAITFKLSVPDFARLVAEEADPQELLFSGRFGIEGDLGLATRVPEMFGAPPQF
jgi:hypothetical protein